MGFRYSNVSLHTDDSLVSTSRFNKVLNAASDIFNPSSASYIGTTTAYNPFGYYGVPIPANQGVVAYATSRVKDFEIGFYRFLEAERPKLLPALAAGKTLTDEIAAGLTEALDEFRKSFLA